MDPWERWVEGLRLSATDGSPSVSRLPREELHTLRALLGRRLTPSERRRAYRLRRSILGPRGRPPPLVPCRRATRLRDTHVDGSGAAAVQWLDRSDDDPLKRPPWLCILHTHTHTPPHTHRHIVRTQRCSPGFQPLERVCAAVWEVAPKARVSKYTLQALCDFVSTLPPDEWTQGREEEAERLPMADWDGEALRSGLLNLLLV